MTVGAVWWGLAAVVGKPTWMDVSWEVKDDRTTVVRYQVSKPTDLTVRCLIEAQGHDHSVVGSIEVVLGPQPKSEMSYETTVRTTGTAVRGGIRNCRSIDDRVSS